LAAQKLGELGDRKAEEALNTALKDSNQMVRDAAKKIVRTINKIKHERSHTRS
jgi:HEAT repeat protein